MNILDLEIPAQAQPKRNWSPFQQDIFQMVDTQKDHLLINAVAGSGKTTTIVEATRYAPNALFLAFNRAIADELASRLPAGEAKTLNALGYALWRQWRPEARMDKDKLRKIIKSLLGEKSEEYREFGYALQRAVGLMKNQALGLDHIQDFLLNDVRELIDSYLDIPADRLDWAAQTALTAFTRSIIDESTFDFDDQLYGPIFHGWSYPFYPTVFVDEFQDLSPIQHLMLDRMALAGARIIGVGDRFQSIYGFRGAQHDSMDDAKSRFNMVEMPLSVTYRCPRSVVNLAQAFNPQIRARDDAPVGLFLDNHLTGEADPEIFFPGWMVLCRNNAPMFASILRHVRNQLPVQVRSNFIESLQGFIRGFKTQWTSDLQTKLDLWREKEIAAAKSRGFRGKIAQIIDKHETISLFTKMFKRTDEVIGLIDQLGSGTTGPIFSTIHKAKGLENPQVFILRPDLMPSIFATTPEQLQQEANMQYVAITRSADSLVFGERWT